MRQTMQAAQVDAFDTPLIIKELKIPNPTSQNPIFKT